MTSVEKTDPLTGVQRVVTVMSAQVTFTGALEISLPDAGANASAAGLSQLVGMRFLEGAAQQEIATSGGSVDCALQFLLG